MESQKNTDIVEQLKAEYLNTMQNWLSDIGIEQHIGRIIQLLRFSDHPLTQSEMQQILNLSKPTISRNLKVMEKINLLNKDLLANSESNDRYAYSLKGNSTYFLFSTYLKKILEALFSRMEDHKIFVNKVDQLTDDQKDNKVIQKLLEFINEENQIFSIMTDKFDSLIAEFSEILFKTT